MKLNHFSSVGEAPCQQSHYATIVEAVAEAEVYQQGATDCPSCLRRMVEKHGALVEIFQERLAALESAPLPREEAP